jgi:Rrf2 family protein
MDYQAEPAVTGESATRRGRPAGSGVVWPSAKTVYALRACTVLAAAAPGERLKAADIARTSRVPLRFLSKILSELRDAGILSAKRGYYGGYAFTRDPREISVADLMLAIAGYELFAPLSRVGLQPHFAFVDELRHTLAQVARDRLCATSLAELAPKA